MTLLMYFCLSWESSLTRSSLSQSILDFSLLIFWRLSTSNRIWENILVMSLFLEANLCLFFAEATARLLNSNLSKLSC